MKQRGRPLRILAPTFLTSWIAVRPLLPRHPDNDILLDDVTVSRRHAEFRLDKDGSWAVADVGSLNGTYVNRQPVDLTVLANNDQVQIGKFRLVFLTAPTTESLRRPGD
jgi:pSer/pThr/pTyr-binding forkhead associated (FHA) protein